ncbi:hypothetical protein [Butyricimonas paravirosa]
MEFPPVEYGEIGVVCLYGNCCGDGNIRGVQVFVGDISIEGVGEEWGNVFILFGNGNGVGRVCAAVYLRGVFHLDLIGEYVLVFGINDHSPFVKSVHVGPAGNVVYGCGNTCHAICQ